MYIFPQSSTGYQACLLVVSASFSVSFPPFSFFFLFFVLVFLYTYFSALVDFLVYVSRLFFVLVISVKF